MRTTKELLEVMLENIDKLKEGLCLLSLDLRCADLITRDEDMIIMLYLENNIKSSRFAWPVGEKEPRIKWLKEQIEKISKDTINN